MNDDVQIALIYNAKRLVMGAIIGDEHVIKSSMYFINRLMELSEIEEARREDDKP